MMNNLFLSVRPIQTFFEDGVSTRRSLVVIGFSANPRKITRKISDHLHMSAVSCTCSSCSNFYTYGYSELRHDSVPDISLLVGNTEIVILALSLSTAQNSHYRFYQYKIPDFNQREIVCSRIRKFLSYYIGIGVLNENILF